MSRELWSTTTCKICGAVVEAVVHERDLDDNGAERGRTWVDKVPHSRQDCERIDRLMREQWPVLFEMER